MATRCSSRTASTARSSRSIPRRIEALDPIPGAKSPLDGTVLGGRAYIPDGAARVLVEIDLATNQIAAVDTLDGAVNPFVAEIAFGDLWVLDYGGQRIWRITP